MHTWCTADWIKDKCGHAVGSSWKTITGDSVPILNNRCWCRNYISGTTTKADVFCQDKVSETEGTTGEAKTTLIAQGCTLAAESQQPVSNLFFGRCAVTNGSACYWNNTDSACNTGYTESGHAATAMTNCCKTCPTNGVNINWNYATNTSGAGAGNTLSGDVIYGTPSGGWTVSGNGGDGLSTCKYIAKTGSTATGKLIEDTKGYFTGPTSGYVCTRNS